MRDTLKGLFKPKNPTKYVGDLTKIIYRSSYELKFMIWCDLNSDVIKWSYETIIIPYKSPIDNKWHRYFVDFKITVKEKDNKLKTYLVEVKPGIQTHEPIPQKRKTRRYLNEVYTWAINKSKWAAAEEYCKDRNWQFQLITEKELNIQR